MIDTAQLTDVGNWIVTRSEGLRWNLGDIGIGGRLMTMNFSADAPDRTLLQMTYEAATQVFVLETTSVGFVISNVATGVPDILSVLPRTVDTEGKGASIIRKLLERGTRLELDMEHGSFTLTIRDFNGSDVQLDACAWTDVFPSHDAFVIHAISGFDPKIAEVDDGWDRLAFQRNDVTQELMLVLVTSGWGKQFEITWSTNGFEIVRPIEIATWDWAERDQRPAPTVGLYAKVIEIGDQFTAALDEYRTLDLRNETQGWETALVPSIEVDRDMI